MYATAFLFSKILIQKQLAKSTFFHTHCKETRKELVFIGRGKTTSKLLFEEAKEFFKKYPNDITRKAYTKNYRKFITYCREHYACKSKVECGMHIAEYSEHLQSCGFSPSTIHTYLAPVAIYHRINLKKIEKPKRKTASFTRGRSFNGKTERSDNDLSNEKYAQTVEFQKCVGIRRAELMRLKGNDLVKDESGYLCIRIKQGKGGKKQWQRILPSDIDFVKSFFAGKAPDEPIFDRTEFKNKLPYHYLRAMQAQRAYRYYEHMCLTKKGRAKLGREIRKRWSKYNLNKRTGKPRRFKESLIKGTYILRGDNKKFALTHNLPTRYDKLALLATSIFHLSHWRNDITINYLLTI